MDPTLGGGRRTLVPRGPGYVHRWDPGHELRAGSGPGRSTLRGFRERS